MYVGGVVRGVAMLEGKCPKCGYYCMGWALANPRHQTCPNCGVGLEIFEDGCRIVTGYSPFSAERYSINLPNNVSTYHDKEKDTRRENERDRP